MPPRIDWNQLDHDWAQLEYPFHSFNQLGIRIDSLRVQAFESHSLWIEVKERGISDISNQVSSDSHWFCIGGEQTPKPLNLILTGLKLRKGVFQIFPIRFQLIPNNSIWYSNESGIIHSWLPADSTLVENRLPSRWISFWVFWCSRKSHFSCFTSGPTWFLIIWDSRPTNPPQLPAWFSVILHWGRTDSQAVNYDSQWIEAGKRVFQVFPIRVQLILNNFRWHRNKSASIHICGPNDSALG